MSLLYKKFALLPDGSHVNGGEASYSFNPDDGSIQWSASVSVSVFFLTKSFSQNGVLKVDPMSLKSAAFKVGQKISMGAVEIEVLSIKDGFGVAKITVNASDVQEVGQAVFDMKHEFVSLESISATGTVKGFGVGLNLRAV